MLDDIVERILNLKSENVAHKFICLALKKIISSICILVFLSVNILDSICFIWNMIGIHFIIGFIESKYNINVNVFFCVDKILFVF